MDTRVVVADSPPDSLTHLLKANLTAEQTDTEDVTYSGIQLYSGIPDITIHREQVPR